MIYGHIIVHGIQFLIMILSKNIVEVAGGPKYREQQLCIRDINNDSINI